MRIFHAVLALLCLNECIHVLCNVKYLIVKFNEMLIVDFTVAQFMDFFAVTLK